MTALPDGWRAARLGDALSVRYGKAIPADDRSSDGAFPLVGSAGRMGIGSRVPLVETPALIIGRKGSVGNVTLESGGCWPTDTTYYVVPEAETFDLQFLFHQLTALDLRSLDSSTAVPSLRRQDLEAQTLAIPPIAEQRRIVDIVEDHLSRLDAANDYLDAAARRSKRAVQAALEALWTASARSGSWMRVEDLGKVVTGSTPKDGASAFGGATPFVTPGDVGYGERVTSWQRTLSDAGAVSSRLLPAGSVLAVCIGATLGKVGWTSVAAATNQQINGVVINLDDVDAAYVAALMAAPGFQDQMRTSASSTTMPILNKSKFSALSLPVATGRAAQSQWERYMRARDASERVGNAVEASGRRGVKLRRAVLRAAFNGSLTGTIAVTSRPVLSESSHV